MFDAIKTFRISPLYYFYGKHQPSFKHETNWAENCTQSGTRIEYQNKGHIMTFILILYAKEYQIIPLLYKLSYLHYKFNFFKANNLSLI